jgi:hypothetical protein
MNYLVKINLMSLAGLATHFKCLLLMPELSAAETRSVRQRGSLITRPGGLK